MITHTHADLPLEYEFGDEVRKLTGYEYSGVVVAAFRNLKGHNRFVVESTSKGSRGMLFIFNASQLERDE